MHASFSSVEIDGPNSLEMPAMNYNADLQVLLHPSTQVVTSSLVVSIPRISKIHMSSSMVVDRDHSEIQNPSLQGLGQQLPNVVLQSVSSSATYQNPVSVVQ